MDMIEYESEQIKRLIATTRRIEDLEQSFMGLSAEIRDLQDERDLGVERIKKLESFIKSTQKVPHRCPVCEGKMTDKLKVKALSNGMHEFVIQCHGCQGAGFVWGD